MNNKNKADLDELVTTQGYGFMMFINSTFYALVATVAFGLIFGDGIPGEYIVYVLLAVFILVFLLKSPKKNSKNLINNIKKEKEEDERLTLLWGNLKNEIIYVNGTARAIGRENNDSKGDVYLYTEVNDTVIRSKIINFYHANDVNKSIKNNVMTSGYEFREHYYSSVQISTEDGMSIDIKSSLEFGNKLEENYLALKHT